MYHACDAPYACTTTLAVLSSKSCLVSHVRRLSVLSHACPFPRSFHAVSRCVCTSCAFLCPHASLSHWPCSNKLSFHDTACLRPLYVVIPRTLPRHLTTLVTASACRGSIAPRLIASLSRTRLSRTHVLPCLASHCRTASLVCTLCLACPVFSVPRLA